MPSPTDIVVVGAGVIGCAVAYELARRGARVHVVEERTPGMGATHAAAGILAPYLEGRTAIPFLEMLVRGLALYDAFITQVEADSGMTVPYRRTGTLQVAVSDEEMHRLEASAAWLHERGVNHTLLGAHDICAAEPHISPAVVGALTVPSHGFVAAGELIRALAAAARRHGAGFVEGRRVRRITMSGGNLVVETDGGAFTGAGVVLAAGSWCGRIEIDGATGRVPIRPVRGQLLRLLSAGPVPGRVVWSERCYVVPWDDGTLLVGATMEDVGFDERVTVAAVRDLIDAACEIVPAARTATFVDARAGLRPASTDSLPIIGRSSVVPGLIYATGHYRNGILLAPLTARVVAAAMLDDRPDPQLALVTPRRFEANSGITL